MWIKFTLHAAAIKFEYICFSVLYYLSLAKVDFVIIVFIWLIDTDECASGENTCEHGYCVNTDGSFTCQCELGFQLDKSGKKCVGEFFHLI